MKRRRTVRADVHNFIFCCERYRLYVTLHRRHRMTGLCHEKNRQQVRDILCLLAVCEKSRASSAKALSKHRSVQIKNAGHPNHPTDTSPKGRVLPPRSAAMQDIPQTLPAFPTSKIKTDQAVRYSRMHWG